MQSICQYRAYITGDSRWGVETEPSHCRAR
ncbi:DNA polymerase I [Listeria phage WIL-1]|nr:DNA polymerase I [Listeria phage WIL-1]